MRTFFRGWKRKVGVVTLVMACMFLGGWMRSLSTEDDFDIRGSLAGSTSGVLYVAWSRFDTPSSTSGITQCWSSSEAQFGMYTAFLQARNEWNWKWGGFRYFGTETELIATIPYWAIVLPLILLSAYLLLVKPRSVAPAKSVQAAPTTGA